MMESQLSAVRKLKRREEKKSFKLKYKFQIAHNQSLIWLHNSSQQSRLGNCHFSKRSLSTVEIIIGENQVKLNSAHTNKSRMKSRSKRPWALVARRRHHSRIACLLCSDESEYKSSICIPLTILCRHKSTEWERNESELHLHPLKWIIFYNSCLCRWWLQLPFVFSQLHVAAAAEQLARLPVHFSRNSISNDHHLEIAIDLIMRFDCCFFLPLCISHIALVF